MKNLGGIEIKQLIDTMILDLIHRIEQEEIDKNKIPSKLMKELSKVSDVRTKKCMHSICITEFSNHLARREGPKPLDKNILATKALLKYFNIELIEDVTLKESLLASLLQSHFRDLSIVDSIIAAIAMNKGMQLVSTDLSGFTPIYHFTKYNEFYSYRLKAKLLKLGGVI